MKASLWDTLCRRRVTPLECGRQCRRQLQPRQKNMKTTTCSCLRWDVPLAESVRLRRTNRARTLLMRFGPVRESDVPEPPLAWAGQFCGPKLATLPGGGGVATTSPRGGRSSSRGSTGLHKLPNELGGKTLLHCKDGVERISSACQPSDSFSRKEDQRISFPARQGTLKLVMATPCRPRDRALL
jgi:hypothetical protein